MNIIKCTSRKVFFNLHQIGHKERNHFRNCKDCSESKEHRKELNTVHAQSVEYFPRASSSHYFVEVAGLEIWSGYLKAMLFCYLLLPIAPIVKGDRFAPLVVVFVEVEM